MTTRRRPIAHYVFYGVILLIVIALVCFVLWVNGQSYRNNVTPYFKALTCIEEGSSKSCSLSYSLKNNSSQRVVTDLNGINGPGFAESHVNDVSAILDDGTTVAIFAGSSMEFSASIQPHETVELTDPFTIPNDRRVVSIKILGESFLIDN